MATRTIANGGGNWSSNGTWVEGAVPTNADDVVATATSGNLTIDATAACRTMDLTGYVATLTHAAGIVLSVGNAAAGSLTLVGTMTYVRGSGASQISFVSTTTGNTITTAGASFGTIVFNGVGGGWTLQDAFTTSTAGTITLTAGSLNTNGKTVTTGQFNSNGSTTRTLTLGASTINCGTTGTAWQFATTTNLTLSAASSTIAFTDTSASSKTFQGSGKTYGTLDLTAASASTNTIVGANTFNTISVGGGVAKTVTFPASTTTTTTNLNLNGSSGKVLTVNSSSSGTAATISVASGTVAANHCSIKDSTVSGGATFVAYDSVGVSGNTGWTFKTPKSLASAGVG